MRLFEMIERRYVCTVLENMRSCCESLNFGGMKGHVEECQHYVERMENGLHQSRGTAQDVWYCLNQKKPDVKGAKKALKKRYDFME